MVATIVMTKWCTQWPSDSRGREQEGEEKEEKKKEEGRQKKKEEEEEWGGGGMRKRRLNSIFTLSIIFCHQ